MTTFLIVVYFIGCIADAAAVKAARQAKAAPPAAAAAWDWPTPTREWEESK